MDNWWPRRMWLAGAAVAVAVGTGAGAGVLTGPGDPVTLAVASGAIAVLALFAPAAVTGWVVWGMVMAGSGMSGPGVGDGLIVVAVVAGVVGAAELLTAVARMDIPMEPAGDGETLRLGMAIAIATAACAVVLVLGGFRGLSGWVAVGVGAGACAILAGALSAPDGSDQ